MINVLREMIGVMRGTFDLWNFAFSECFCCPKTSALVSDMGGVGDNRILMWINIAYPDIVLEMSILLNPTPLPQLEDEYFRMIK